MPRLAYYGDLKLETELRSIVPSEARGNVQVHIGVDRLRALYVTTSPNYTTPLEVRCFWAPESDFSKTGFRAREMAVREALVARSEELHPVFWIEDDSLSKTVGSYSAPSVTSTSHGFSDGDVVLIRRLGSGLYTYGQISNATTNTFDLGDSHGITTGDDIHLVEKYWAGMVYNQMGAITPAEHGDYYAEDVTYSFSGSGDTTYQRTSITLD